MENLKIKIGNAEIDISLGWFIFIIALLVWAGLLIFDILPFGTIYREVIRIWRDIKK